MSSITTVTALPQILLVEDDELSRQMLLRLLRRLPFDVVGAVASGEAALEALTRVQPSVILMDIVLDGQLDGIQTARQIRKRFDVPVVFLTGLDDEHYVQAALDSDSQAYLLKPPQPRELHIALEHALYRHRYERELITQEALLTQTLGSLPIGVLVLDDKTRARYVNTAALQLLGLEHHPSRGTQLAELFPHLSDLSGTPVALPQALADGNCEGPCWRLGRPDGTARYLRIQRQDLPGQPGGQLLTLRDVTDEHLSQQRVQLLATAMESLEEAIVITESPALRIHYANRAFARLHGRDTTALQGQDLDAVLGQAIAEQCRAALSAPDQAPAPLSECTCQPVGGEAFIAQWTVAPLPRSPGGTPLHAFIFRDCTRLRRLEENLRQSQKLEAVGRLADGLAHDFNNIIAIINGLSELLKLASPQDSKTHERACQILETGRRGADIIAQLMAFSRADREEVEPVDLSVALPSLGALIQHLLPDNIRLETSLNEHALPPIAANRTQLEQVILNLCTNARDAFHGAEGSITLRVEARRLDAVRAASANPQAPEGDYAVVSVSDTGCGIPSDVLPQVFDPFFTTKPLGKGTGLGLSSVYGIVRQHGGTVTIQTAPDRGTTVSTWWPFHARSAEAQAVTRSLVAEAAAEAEAVSA